MTGEETLPCATAAHALPGLMILSAHPANQMVQVQNGPWNAKFTGIPRLAHLIKIVPRFPCILFNLLPHFCDFPSSPIFSSSSKTKSCSCHMKKRLLALVPLVAAISTTHAAIVFSDTFSYSDGNLTDVSSGTWFAHSSGGSNPMQATNGQVQVRGLSSAEDDSANLAGGPYATNSGVTLYSTYDLIISNQAGLPTALGGYISHFKDAAAGFSFHGRVFISTSNYLGATFAPPGSFYIGIGNGSLANGSLPGSTAVVQLPNILTTGTVYTVVTRCVLGNNQQSTIWINPNSESDLSATATDFNDPTNQSAMNCYAFRQNSGGGTVYVDNLRVGTHFADVAGANTAPTISSIPDQDIPASSNTGPLDFMVNDDETPGSLTVTATSSNPALIPNNPANLTLGGSGLNRTITVTPVAGLQGQSTITVNVSDSVNTSFTTFLVRVGAPTISDIPNQMAITNTPIPPISFTVSDAESDALTLYGSSSNPALLTSGNIVFGGSGSSRTVTLTPEPDQSGVTTVHVDVTDGQTTNS